LPPGRKYERGTLSGLDLKSLLQIGRHVSAADALALLDQVIFNLLVANTDAHAKNYCSILPVGGRPRLVPLYDVSKAPFWPHVVKTYAQSIDGKYRRPDTVAGRHWEAIVREVGYRPTDVKNRVQQIAGAMVANKVNVTAEVAALAGVIQGYMAQTADTVEENAMRMAGRL
jgi:serine/threonine-protein kinase HipA